MGNTKWAFWENYGQKNRKTTILLWLTPLGQEGRQTPPANLSLMTVLDLARGFMVGCPNALVASSACSVTEGRFTPHFSFLADFCIGRWNAEVSCPVGTQPVWPACWIDPPDGSSSSSSRAVQGAWDIYRVVPPELVLALRTEYKESDVDGFWRAWSKGAESGLFRAYCWAGGPTTAGVHAFFGRGAIRRRLGGRSV